MAVTDTQLFTEIYWHLIEYDGYTAGSPTPSGLYTQAEIAAALNYRLYEFAKLTGCLASSSNHLTSTANIRDYVLADTAVDVLHVAYSASSPAFTSLAKGSSIEADMILSDVKTSVSLPSIWTVELGDVNSISLLPPPANSGRTIHMTYTRRPATIAATPAAAAVDLPDDFTPFVKYGALAELFGKSGETYDPARSQVCEMLYQLGVQAVKQWVSGPVDPAQSG